MTKQILITLWLGGLLAVSSRAAEDRIMAPVNPARTVSLPRHVHPRTRLSADLGPVDPEAPIEGVIALFKPAAGLDALLASQQIPGTPDYRRWLTPEEFGARFGASDGDLARVRGWIEAQGLRVNRIARGRMYIEFSGPAGRLGRALHTSFRHYEIGGRKHFANSSDSEIQKRWRR